MHQIPLWLFMWEAQSTRYMKHYNSTQPNYFNIALHISLYQYHTLSPASTHVHVYSHAQEHTPTHTHTHTHTNMRACMSTHTPTHTCTYTHKHAHTHAHTILQPLASLSLSQYPPPSPPSIITSDPVKTSAAIFVKNLVHTIRLSVCTVVVHVAGEGVHECLLPLFYGVWLAGLQLLGSVLQQVPQLACQTETVPHHQAVHHDC